MSDLVANMRQRQLPRPDAAPSAAAVVLVPSGAASIAMGFAILGQSLSAASSSSSNSGQLSLRQTSSSKRFTSSASYGASPSRGIPPTATSTVTPTPHASQPPWPASYPTISDATAHFLPPVGGPHQQPSHPAHAPSTSPATPASSQLPPSASPPAPGLPRPSLSSAGSSCASADGSHTSLPSCSSSGSAASVPSASLQGAPAAKPTLCAAAKPTLDPNINSNPKSKSDHPAHPWSHWEAAVAQAPPLSPWHHRQASDAARPPCPPLQVVHGALLPQHDPRQPGSPSQLRTILNNPTSQQQQQQRMSIGDGMAIPASQQHPLGGGGGGALQARPGASSPAQPLRPSARNPSPDLLAHQQQLQHQQCLQQQQQQLPGYSSRPPSATHRTSAHASSLPLKPWSPQTLASLSSPPSPLPSQQQQVRGNQQQLPPLQQSLQLQHPPQHPQRLLQHLGQGLLATGAEAWQASAAVIALAGEAGFAHGVHGVSGAEQRGSGEEEGGTVGDSDEESYEDGGQQGHSREVGGEASGQSTEQPSSPGDTHSGFIGGGMVPQADRPGGAVTADGGGGHGEDSGKLRGEGHRPGSNVSPSYDGSRTLGKETMPLEEDNTILGEDITPLGEESMPSAKQRKKGRKKGKGKGGKGGACSGKAASAPSGSGCSLVGRSARNSSMGHSTGEVTSMGRSTGEASAGAPRQPCTALRSESAARGVEGRVCGSGLSAGKCGDGGVVDQDKLMGRGECMVPSSPMPTRAGGLQGRPPLPHPSPPSHLLGHVAMHVSTPLQGQERVHCQNLREGWDQGHGTDQGTGQGQGRGQEHKQEGDSMAESRGQDQPRSQVQGTASPSPATRAASRDPSLAMGASLGLSLTATPARLQLPPPSARGRSVSVGRGALRSSRPSAGPSASRSPIPAGGRRPSLASSTMPLPSSLGATTSLAATAAAGASSVYAATSRLAPADWLGLEQGPAGQRRAAGSPAGGERAGLDWKEEQRRAQERLEAYSKAREAKAKEAAAEETNRRRAAQDARNAQKAVKERQREEVYALNAILRMSEQAFINQLLEAATRAAKRLSQAGQGDGPSFRSRSPSAALGAAAGTMPSMDRPLSARLGTLAAAAAASKGSRPPSAFRGAALDRADSRKGSETSGNAQGEDTASGVGVVGHGVGTLAALAFGDQLCGEGVDEGDVSGVAELEEATDAALVEGILSRMAHGV